MLLGAEVITSILPDGRRTGPRGTPSAINAGLGWVLLRKTHDRDVVDVANYTLEQSELKYMTGSRRSYAAVFTAEKKNDLHRSRRRNGRVAKVLPLDLRPESTHDDCRITQRVFGRLMTSQLAKNRELVSDKRWRNTWETKGFRQAVCWRHIALIEFYVLCSL